MLLAVVALRLLTICFLQLVELLLGSRTLADEMAHQAAELLSFCSSILLQLMSLGCLEFG